MDIERKKLRDKQNKDEISFEELPDLQVLDCHEVEATGIGWKTVYYPQYVQPASP